MDALFFVDLPGSAERRLIWDMYRRQYGIAANQLTPNDSDFTGAEIRACCRLSALLDISLAEAAINVVPIAQTAAEAVTKLRQWASGRCLSADRPGVYRQEGARESTRRKISPKPSAN